MKTYSLPSISHTKSLNHASWHQHIHLCFLIKGEQQNHKIIEKGNNNPAGTKVSKVSAREGKGKKINTQPKQNSTAFVQVVLFCQRNQKQRRKLPFHLFNFYPWISFILVNSLSPCVCLSLSLSLSFSVSGSLTLTLALALPRSLLPCCRCFLYQRQTGRQTDSRSSPYIPPSIVRASPSSMLHDPRTYSKDYSVREVKDPIERIHPEYLPRTFRKLLTNPTRFLYT